MENDAKSDNKASAINAVFVFFVIGAILFASYTGKMKEVTDASFDSAKAAVSLSIGLIGIMALWLGLVRILEAGGLMFSLAKLLRPIMLRLFPDVPGTHPAMGAMILNMSANMLGLGNAATPFGIKAMVELDKLNPSKGTATNAMCLFLAINTSSVALFPLGVIGVRAAANAADPAAIWLPTTIATLASTIVGVLLATWLGRRDTAYRQEVQSQSVEPLEQSDTGKEESTIVETDYSHLLYSPGLTTRLVLPASCLIFIGAIVFGVYGSGVAGFFNADFVSHWLMPALMLLIVAYGASRGVKVYEAVTEGAKQGFDIAVRIIPFLVAILVAIGMFRASGAMELVSSALTPLTSLIGMPAETLPMALIRPLSGTGAFGVMSELVSQNPDSYEAFVASTMMGSTETTFYVLAVYFGAIGITRIRHALVAALAADIVGIIVSCIAASAFY
jgi:spore maturation protein SpmA